MEEGRTPRRGFEATTSLKRQSKPRPFDNEKKYLEWKRGGFSAHNAQMDPTGPKTLQKPILPRIITTTRRQKKVPNPNSSGADLNVTMATSFLLLPRI